jgi:hypothetical protein
MRPSSLLAPNAVTNMNRRASRLITAMTAAAALALPAAGCGTRPPAGQSGPLRAIVTASVTSPGEFQHVAAGPDAAWVTTGNALVRVDRRTDRVRTVLADPGAALTTVTYGAGSVWVGDGDAGLLKIDPVTGRVEARLRGAGFRQSFGYDALWNAGYRRAGPALWRTDPATGRTRAYPLPCLKQFGLAVGAGGVWVSGVCSARGALPGRPPYFSLVRADPATGQVTARYSARPSPLDIVAGNCAVCASGIGVVMRIDPLTGRTTTSIVVPASPRPPGCGRCSGRCARPTDDTGTWRICDGPTLSARPPSRSQQRPAPPKDAQPRSNASTLFDVDRGRMPTSGGCPGSG